MILNAHNPLVSTEAGQAHFTVAVRPEDHTVLNTGCGYSYTYVIAHVQDQAEEIRCRQSLIT